MSSAEFFTQLVSVNSSAKKSKSADILLQQVWCLGTTIKLSKKLIYNETKYLPITSALFNNMHQIDPFFVNIALLFVQTIQPNETFHH